MNAGTITLLKEIGLTSEQIVAVLEVIAEQLAPLNRIRLSAVQRQAKRRHVILSRDNNVIASQTDAAKEIPPTPPKENTTNLSVVSNPPMVPPSKTEPERFSEFWAVYPPRYGTRDRKGAEKAYVAALKRGATPDEIISGAGAYAAFCAATGKLNTEMIRQARTWLNANGWMETFNAPNTRQPNTIANGFALVDAAIADLQRREDAERERQRQPDSEGIPRLRQIPA